MASKRLFIVNLMLTGTLSMAGCGGSGGSESPRTQWPQPESVLLGSLTSRDVHPTVDGRDLTALGAGNRAFALDMFATVAASKPDVNVALGPYSISALAMLYAGARYAAETHLDNSVALVPMEKEKSDYALVNWARWDASALRHFWNQLSKKSFWRVTANLEANHAASMPVYCRLA